MSSGVLGFCDNGDVVDESLLLSRTADENSGPGRNGLSKVYTVDLDAAW